ncbi:MDR family MFS transporter [Pseudomonas aeruginosa]|uniref:MDR family MFS transporter n=1 Tax=Pseudomonas aeruginosa TaxID=287 RepID=UPI0010432092|nr:MDR family MFS transporter [Pseudomonas aeruginosa]
MSADDKVSLRAWVAVTGGLFGCFMAGMNVHVTSAALPEIEGALGATFEEGSWISTAYLVAEISMIPLTAWLVEVFSLRRVMLLGSLVFLLSSLSCALAPNLSTLILIRVIQGASGAVLIPLSMQLILTELPSSRIPLGMALFSLSNSVAQAAGPSIGGWLADAYSWRWIFLLQLLPGIALLAAVAWSIRLRDGDRERLRQADWLGINLRLLGSYNFGVSSLAMAVFGAATFGLVFLVPNYLSQLQGFNARQIGDSLILYGLVQLLLAPLLPRLMRWLNPKLLVAGGFAIMALGCWMGAHLNTDAGRNVIIPSIVVRGIGQPLIMVALSVLAVKGLDKAQAGSASALISMLRNLGGAIGTALLTQLVSLRERFHSERIGETLTIFDGALQQRLGGGQVRIQLPEQQQALALLDHGVRQQAYLMAYSDAFYLSCVALLACALASLMLRQKD